jgi:hypothetical protein
VIHSLTQVEIVQYPRYREVHDRVFDARTILELAIEYRRITNLPRMVSVRHHRGVTAASPAWLQQFLQPGLHGVVHIIGAAHGNGGSLVRAN